MEIIEKLFLLFALSRSPSFSTFASFDILCNAWKSIQLILHIQRHTTKNMWKCVYEFATLSDFAFVLFCDSLE